MTDINPKLFKKYDIRGVAMGEKALINQDVAFAIGQGIATYLHYHHEINQVVVGRDNRHTSYDLQSALMEGIQRGGGNVMDIGLVSTPLVYWHAVDKGNTGGVMVTGSHLTPEYNGFKMSIGGKTIFGNEIQIIRELIAGDKLYTGQGTYAGNSSAYTQYLYDIRDRIPVTGKSRIVIDPGNGTAGVFAPRLLEYWGQDVIGINIEPDGSYPNHLANPQEEKNMKQLSEKVLEVGAEIGFAYDGDADRVGVVDEKGQMISADRIMALLAKDMLQRHPGAAVVADVLSSQTLFDTVVKAGGEAYMAASGHSLVKEAMKEHNALLGGEMSGHMFFSEDYFGFDDAYFATGRILQLLQSTYTPLSKLNAELPFYYSTPEYRPHCPDEDKADIIATIGELMADKGEIVDVDGVRVQFEKGWGILRASNTEPVLSLRFEGETEADALQYRDLFAKALKQFPQIEKFV